LLHRAEQVVLNGDDPYLREQAPDLFPDAHWTSAQGPDAIAPLKPLVYIDQGWVRVAEQPIVKVDALSMVGSHNQQNLLLAVAAAHLAGIEAGAIAQGVTNFPGVPHRLEKICTWQGIDFINDSKATNYDAAEVGLQAVAAPALLIAGGAPKEGDDTAWLQVIQTKAAHVLLIGDAAAAFAERLKAVGYSAYTCLETMDQAIERSRELAPELGAKVVLLSPACASFDQYPNFEVRGDHFRQLCQEMLN
jgi:UDP-N-acetylmuramoylalanine--D-glutamate ligase